jgi:thioredoxin 1
MRKIILFTAFICLAANAFSQGIVFHKGSWQSLLEEAKKTNRPFFVDYYTDWCGPCKMMSKHTFTDATLGAFANQNFLAFKLNAEQGEGVELAGRANIQAYPTIVFYSPDGKELGRSLGFMDAATFQKVLEKYASLNHNRSQGSTGPKQMKSLSPSDRAALRAAFGN